MNEHGNTPDITALVARRMRCTNCKRRFRPQDLTPLESRDRFRAYSFRCAMCSAERVVLASWTKTSLRTHATDLDAEEWKFYRDAPTVDADDVLRVHSMLAAYDGDLSDVLEDPILEPKPH